MKQPHKNRYNNQGFTLVETGVVLFIVGLLFGTIIFTTQARIDATRIYVTKSRMQLIADAIDLYVKNYGHIPCPADITALRTNFNYGWGTGSGNNVASNCIKTTSIGTTSTSRIVKGMVPFKTLPIQVDPQITVDGWGNRFTYIITEDYSKYTNFTSATELGTGYIICNQVGSCAASTNNMVQNNGTTKRGDVAYILISHGYTGHGAYKDNTPSAALSNTLALGTADAENGDDDNNFVQAMPNSGYQDILIFRNRWQLPAFLN
jgi:type II secretory pathway pseudopilin PulG